MKGVSLDILLAHCTEELAILKHKRKMSYEFCSLNKDIWQPIAKNRQSRSRLRIAHRRRTDQRDAMQKIITEQKVKLINLAGSIAEKGFSQ